MNQNNLKNSIGYWERFLVKIQDYIHAFKCVEPSNPPHTHCSFTFKKLGLDLLFEISNFHRSGPIVDFF
jgi:hypothetical protein